MKRNIVIFDTETTGLGSTDEVIQFSAIVMTQLDDKIDFKDVISFYADTNKHIAPGASAVHGITNTELTRLSNGKYFEEQIGKYQDIIDPSVPTIFIAYNIAFDKRLVNQTLEQNGYLPIDFGRTITSMPNDNRGNYNLCLMRYCEQIYTGGKRVKLESIMQKYVKADLQNTLYKKLKAKYNIQDSATDGYHDALYDTVACVVIFIQNKLHLAY